MVIRGSLRARYTLNEYVFLSGEYTSSKGFKFGRQLNLLLELK